MEAIGFIRYPVALHHPLQAKSDPGFFFSRASSQLGVQSVASLRMITRYAGSLSRIHRPCHSHVPAHSGFTGQLQEFFGVTQRSPGLSAFLHFFLLFIARLGCPIRELSLSLLSASQPLRPANPPACTETRLRYAYVGLTSCMFGAAILS